MSYLFRAVGYKFSHTCASSPTCADPTTVPFPWIGRVNVGARAARAAPALVCAGLPRSATSHMRCLTKHVLSSNDTFFPQSKTSSMEVGLPRVRLRHKVPVSQWVFRNSWKRTSVQNLAQAAGQHCAVPLELTSRLSPLPTVHPGSLRHPLRWPPASGLSSETLSTSLQEKSL